jgi:hypothetical protein
MDPTHEQAAKDLIAALGKNPGLTLVDEIALAQVHALLAIHEELVFLSQLAAAR